MQYFPKKLLMLIISVLCIVIYSCSTERDDEIVTEANEEISQPDESPLIYHMSFINRYAKKLYFAGEAENWELADIYSHEIEEISEDIVSRGEQHDGINVSQLMESMLLPQIEQIEEAIDSGDREIFMDRYNVMIQTCNQCHTASDYGAVKVTVPETNPFNQDFEVN